MVAIVARHLAGMGTDAEQSGGLRSGKERTKFVRDGLTSSSVWLLYNADVPFDTGLAITGTRVLQRDCSGACSIYHHPRTPLPALGQVHTEGSSVGTYMDE
jgi:hypothetical protein